MFDRCSILSEDIREMGEVGEGRRPRMGDLSSLFDYLRRRDGRTVQVPYYFRIAGAAVLLGHEAMSLRL